MNLIRKTPRQALVIVACCLSLYPGFPVDVSYASAAPAKFENSRVFQASKLLPPELLAGPNFKVDEKVVNDGFLNHYKIQSPFENYEAVTNFILKKRIREIAAIEAMKKIDTTDTASTSVVDSGKKTAAGVKHLFTHPKDSLEGAAKGAGSLFDRAGEALKSDPSQTEDSRVQQLIGYSKSKRDIAVKFGVDVYSENRALQDELNRLAWADYGGGIGVSAALAVVPGGAGIVLSVSGAARLLNDAINMTPPTELRHQNRKKLIDMGMDPDTIELFINNSAFSPRNQTWLVASLDKMKGVSNRELFLKVALQANDSTMSLLITHMAVMCAGYHARIAPVEHLFPIARILYAKDRSGKIVLVIPTDHILWSERFAGAVTEMQEKNNGAKLELWTAGDVSPQATGQPHPGRLDNP